VQPLLAALWSGAQRVVFYAAARVYRQNSYHPR
jgi:hypothetical protein